MEQNNPVERFHELQGTYDQIFGPGTALELKDELALGSGMFNDELTTEEIRELNEELERRISE